MELKDKKNYLYQIYTTLCGAYYNKINTYTKEQFENITSSLITSKLALGNLEKDEILITTAKNLAEKFYDYAKMSHGKMSQKEFENVFQEEITHLDKRNYDMSNLRDDSLIGRDANSTPRIAYKKSKNETYYFENMKGERIAIEKIGDLGYAGFNKSLSRLGNYNITIIDKNGKGTIKNVYTNISIFDMQDTEYRNIVLNELLSKNNMEKSNANGYIGEVIDVVDGDFKKGEKEVNNSVGYMYNEGNGKAILYDKSDLTAVAMHKSQKDKVMLNDNEKNKLLDRDRDE